MIKFFGGAASKNVLNKDPGKSKSHRKPEMRAVMVDIINAVMHNRYEKPETREVMLKINPEGKHDANQVRKRIHQGRELNMYEKPEMRKMMIKFFGDTVFKNTLDKDPGEHKAGRGSQHQCDGRGQRGEEATV